MLQSLDSELLSKIMFCISARLKFFFFEKIKRNEQLVFVFVVKAIIGIFRVKLFKRL